MDLRAAGAPPLPQPGQVASTPAPPKRTGACRLSKWRMTLAGMPGAAQGVT